MVNNLTPLYLSTLILSTITETSRYNLRNANDIRTINTRTTQYYNSFLPSTIREWNTLPKEQRTSATLLSFKAQINQHSTSIPKYYYSEIASHKYYILAFVPNAVVLTMTSILEILQIHHFAHVAISKLPSITFCTAVGITCNDTRC